MKKLRTIAIAAFLLLAVTAGSASAGALITSAQIKDDTVAGVDIKNQNLTGADVQDGSLSTFFDFLGVVPGPKGEPGPQGYPGPNGVGSLEQHNNVRTLSPGQRVTWQSYCSVGQTAIGGGISSTQPGAVTIEQSFPDGFYWTVQAYNSSNATVQAYAWTLCVPV